jgi:hypothetical protein
MPGCVGRDYGVISDAPPKSYLHAAQGSAEQVALCAHNDTLGGDADVGAELVQQRVARLAVLLWGKLPHSAAVLYPPAASRLRLPALSNSGVVTGPQPSFQFGKS